MKVAAFVFSAVIQASGQKDRLYIKYTRLPIGSQFREHEFILLIYPLQAFFPAMRQICTLQRL